MGTKKTEHSGRCSNCTEQKKTLRTVQMRRGWGKGFGGWCMRQDLCADCRKRAQGRWRYA